MKHTPGPWMTARVNQHWSIFGQHGMTIAAATKAEDAQLLAAAPELAEACERAQRKLEAYVGVCSGDKELTDAILPMLRAALRKARREG